MPPPSLQHRPGSSFYSLGLSSRGDMQPLGAWKRPAAKRQDGHSRRSPTQLRHHFLHVRLLSPGMRAAIHVLLLRASGLHLTQVNCRRGSTN